MTFRFHAPMASGVSLVGTFNDWHAGKNRMIRRGEMWECSIPLKEGVHEYKFRIGEDWFWDPGRPPQATGGNSLIEVRRRPRGLGDEEILIQPEDWVETPLILLEPATGLHSFQQELMRAYVYIIGTDKHKLKIADGSLLNPDNLPSAPPARWGWSIDSASGLSMMALTVQSNTAFFELNHPLFAPPGEWLSAQRDHAGKIYGDISLDFSGPGTPPTNSAWAAARWELRHPRPFADVHAINLMTDFGRREGWSRELLREMAVVYADMSLNYRYPSIAGWAPMVFAARAVVYADLARADRQTDEIMAYVLCRIGRPADGAVFLPERPRTFHGRLAAAMARGQTAQLAAWAGSPDLYGIDLAPGHASRPADMDNFPSVWKAKVLQILADLLFLDGQEDLARGYLEGFLQHTPYDFASHGRAFERGGLSAGYIHARTALVLAASPKLWRSVLQGDSPGHVEAAPVGSPVIRPAPDSLPEVTEQDVAEISLMFREKQREVLDCTSGAIPPSARLLLLRDMLNVAWWYNAMFFGELTYCRSGCQRLLQLMATWKPLQPEMEAFTRFLMVHPLHDHAYDAIRSAFTRSVRPPDTFDYIRLVRETFRTWLMDKAQSFYPLVPTVQSDLYPDYQMGESIYVFGGMEQLRANFRRLNPMSSHGYPAGGPLPKPGSPGDIPEPLFEASYGLNRRLAGAWARQFDKESQEAALAFFRRSMEITPYEIEIYSSYADILMDNGRYGEVVSLAESCPGSIWGRERSAVYRAGVCAALELGDIDRALHLSRLAAVSGDYSSVDLRAYLLELTGELQQAHELVKALDVRFDSDDELFFLARQMPERAEEKAPEVFSWLEQFGDLDAADAENRFSFNEFKIYPFYYAALDRWERALWLLKPLAEAVQNDYIWFMLMTVGQKTGDQAAIDLAQHVLAEHVFNAWGDFARFMRGQTTWEEVLNAARNDDTPQPMYYLAGVMAEQRGDATLAVRLYKQAMDPRFMVGAWFTMAWQALDRLGHDPMSHARRLFPEEAEFWLSASE